MRQNVRVKELAGAESLHSKQLCWPACNSVEHHTYAVGRGSWTDIAKIRYVLAVYKLRPVSFPSSIH